MLTVMAIFTALPPAKSGEGGRVMLTTGGPGTTVSVAAEVVVLMTVFVNTAWYWFPLCDSVTDGTISVADVAPVIFVNAPPFMLTCHCTVGAGLPLAAAVKVAVPAPLPS